MAYNTNKLKKQALKAIKEHGLYFIEDVIAYLPCSKPTFYDHFPNESDIYKSIVEELEENRIVDKVSMRKKWKDSDNATLQMGLMKLLSSDEERRRLSMEYREHSGTIAHPTNLQDLYDQEETDTES